jgi:hypothetical protein
MKKEEQKQHLIDMMRYDENLGLYKETPPIANVLLADSNCVHDWHIYFNKGYKKCNKCGLEKTR